MHPPSAFLLPCPRIPAIVPSTRASCTSFLSAFGPNRPKAQAGEVGSRSGPKICVRLVLVGARLSRGWNVEAAEDILVGVEEGGVATITLNRPAKRNAVSLA